MKNIPVFTTEKGVGSLVLREIPYSKTAYITIQSAMDPEAFLKECVDFCVSVGADKIYATGHDCLEKFPYHTSIWKMARPMEGIPDTDAALFPVTLKTSESWRNVYNEKMQDVPNAAWFSWTDGKRLVKEGNGYFIHRNGKLLGIGIASGDTIDALASVVPGCGSQIVSALCHCLVGDTVQLQVASENTRAVRLYEKMGFIKTAELSSWYRVK